jgi:hypothetical protein
MIAPLIIALIAAVVSVALTAIFLRPKPPKPASTSDLEDPVAEAGKPIPVVFGTVTVKGLNILWSGNKWKANYMQKDSSKK